VNKINTQKQNKSGEKYFFLAVGHFFFFKFWREIQKMNKKLFYEKLFF